MIYLRYIDFERTKFIKGPLISSMLQNNFFRYKMTPEGYTRVYVGGLNESIKKEDLQMEFEKYGKLNKVWVAFNPPGFAFIEFLNMNEAELACNSMNGTEIMCQVKSGNFTW